jgi:hypothetical protein
MGSFPYTDLIPEMCHGDYEIDDGRKRRPGRDLNPGQKLRRLLGYPLPYRDPDNADWNCLLMNRT